MKITIMKVCKNCGSPDVAQSAWRHCNLNRVFPMEVIFEWCFNCKKDTVIITKEEFLKNLQMMYKKFAEDSLKFAHKQLPENKPEIKVVEPKVLHVTAKVLSNEEYRPHHPTLHPGSGKPLSRERIIPRRYTHSWISVRNAKKYERMSDGREILWNTEKDGKVRMKYIIEEFKQGPNANKRRKK
jgi:hypothetical protein